MYGGGVPGVQAGGGQVIDHRRKRSNNWRDVDTGVCAGGEKTCRSVRVRIKRGLRRHNKIVTTGGLSNDKEKSERY